MYCYINQSNKQAVTYPKITFNLSECMINDHIRYRVGYQTLNLLNSSFSPHSEPPDCRNNRRGQQKNLGMKFKVWTILLEGSDGNVPALEI